MNSAWERPTPEHPLLAGLLVDVSGSMLTSINNRAGRTISRLESFRDSLEELVKRAKELLLDEHRSRVAPLVQVFAYGFGFGNPLASLFGRGGPDVRDLLELGDGSSSTVPIDRLADEWWRYKRHLEQLAYAMAGNTPMAGGFREIIARFQSEFRRARFSGLPTLFVLSDGEPTDDPVGRIPQLATELKRLGVLVISCYVTDEDIAAPRHLYGQPQAHWPGGARLMFEAASVVPSDSPFSSYLREFGWRVEQDARLFTQVNQSEVLAEFLSLILSPLQSEAAGSAALRPGDSSESANKSLSARTRDRVFVSYAHEDVRWLERLAVHLRPLEREGRVDLWADTRITPGADWRVEIATALEHATVAILLISADYLASDFVANHELPQMLAAAQLQGLTVLPVVVGPSQFTNTPALSRFQSVNAPDRPLVGLRSHEREDVLNRVTDVIRGRLQL